MVDTDSPSPVASSQPQVEVPNGNRKPGTCCRRGDSIDRMKLAGRRNSLDIKMLVAVTGTSQLQRLLQIREHREVTHLKEPQHTAGHAVINNNCELRIIRKGDF